MCVCYVVWGLHMYGDRTVGVVLMVNREAIGTVRIKTLYLFINGPDLCSSKAGQTDTALPTSRVVCRNPTKKKGGLIFACWVGPPDYSPTHLYRCSVHMPTLKTLTTTYSTIIGPALRTRFGSVCLGHKQQGTGPFLGFACTLKPKVRMGPRQHLA